jgi:hypothetical protein
MDGAILWRYRNRRDFDLRLSLSPLEALQSDVAHSGDGVNTSERNVDVAGTLELAHLSF